MKKKPDQVMSDFAGFDAKPDDQFWKMWRKGAPDHFVYVFAHVWVDARSVALCYFRDTKGFSVGYDQVEGVLHDERQATLALGDVLLRKDQTGGAAAFEATRGVSGHGARRGQSLRKRESVAQQGGCIDSPVPYRVQANGLGVVSAHLGHDEEASPGRAEGGKEPAHPGGDRDDADRDPAVGGPVGSPGTSR